MNQHIHDYYFYSSMITILGFILMLLVLIGGIDFIASLVALFSAITIIIGMFAILLGKDILEDKE